MDKEEIVADIKSVIQSHIDGDISINESMIEKIPSSLVLTQIHAELLNLLSSKASNPEDFEDNFEVSDVFQFTTIKELSEYIYNVLQDEERL